MSISLKQTKNLQRRNSNVAILATFQFEGRVLIKIDVFVVLRIPSFIVKLFQDFSFLLFYGNQTDLQFKGHFWKLKRNRYTNSFCLFFFSNKMHHLILKLGYPVPLVKRHQNEAC